MARPGLQTPRQPGAVRTFLIADIRGYTRFTNQLGDEAASRLAAKFALLMSEGIEAWEGALVELRGDEALAVFDSARMALRAAVELQEAFADETQAEPQLPLTVGIGLDAGEAVPVGDGFRGAALNLAARLCASAAAGEILATETLVHLAGRVDGLVYTQQEPAAFKGIEQPVTAVLVASKGTASPALKASDPPAGTKPTMPPELDSFVPFAGRARELRWLGWHWRRARHGHRRVVGISGPIGIGKTRLAAELAAMAHVDGGDVIYRAGAQITAGAIAADRARVGAALIVVDDLDRASVAALTSAGAPGPSGGSGSTLMVVTFGDAALGPVRDALQLLQVEDRRVLDGLDEEAVREIAAVYADDAVDELPLQLIYEESEGVPASVHRLASQWTRSLATQRLGESAERTAAGRRGLRAAEVALIGDVADLERATARGRLFEMDAQSSEPADRPIVVCPYKGLASFEQEDAEYFFGRDRVVAELIAKLVGSPFVAVVGASGSGKSSVLRAGLLPGLANGVLPGSDLWIQIVMRPGEHPLDELRRPLAAISATQGAVGTAELLDGVLSGLASGQRLLLVVDQFEELFSVSGDEGERHDFIELLTTPRVGLKVIVAIRADHYGHGAAYPTLARLLGTDQVLVGPLTRTELAAVIEHPAQGVGLRVESALTEALVADAGAEPGALPLLSTALLELWHARDRGRLTLAAYLGRGGLRGAVARLAESAFRMLTPAQQAVARGVMLRLAGQGEGDAIVRRRVPIEEFDVDRDPAVAEVLDTLTAQRLLTASDGFVEVAHEALLREWPRLQGWLDEDAAGRRLRLHLISAAREWDERGREAADLYRGARLAAMLDWATEHDPELNASERAFLDASRENAERETDRQRRANRRLRGLLAGATVFLVATIGAGALALVQREQAETEAARADAAAARADAAAEEATAEREAAEAAEAVARSRELAASAISSLDDDPSLSKLLALSAATIADPPIETIAALHQAWAADRIVHRYEWPAEHLADDLGATLDPSGRLIAASGGSHHLEVVDWRSGEVAWAYDTGTEEAWISQPYFTRDGEFVVASVLYAPEPASPADPPDDLVGLHFWQADSGELVRTLPIGRCGGFLLAMSDTHAVVSAEVDEGPCTEFEDLANDLVDLETGERTRLTPNGGPATQSSGSTFLRVLTAQLSADGRFAAFDDFSGTRLVSHVVETDTGDRVLTIDPIDLSQLDTSPRALNADGSLLVYGDRPAQVWDVAAQEVIASFYGHTSFAPFAAFSSDGDSVYSTGQDSTLRHWDARTGEELERYPGIGFGRVALASGFALVAPSQGSTADLVDLRPRGEVTAIETCRGHVLRTQLTVAGGVAAFSVACEGDPTSTSLVADLAAAELVVSESGAVGQDQTLSPDGSRFVRQEGSFPIVGPLTIRDAATGAVLVELDGLCTWEANLVDDALDAQPGCSEIPTPPFRFWAQELRWSADGTSVLGVTDEGGGGLMVWNATSGDLLRAESIDATSAIFTPDGSEVIAASGEDDGPHLVRYSIADGQIVENKAVGIGDSSLIGYSADGSILYLVDQGRTFEDGAMRAVAADDFDLLRSRERLNEGGVSAAAMSPDGSLIATGSSDGFVRVWSADTFALVHEISIGDTQANGVAFVTGTQLAVTPVEGGLLVYAIDNQELLSIVRASLSRGLTEAECERFNFGDTCPTLAELRGEE